MHVCAPNVYLMPSEARRGVGSPITGQTVVGSPGDARNTVLLERVRAGRGLASLIKAFERQRQEEQGSQPGLCYILRPCVRKQNASRVHSCSTNKVLRTDLKMNHMANGQDSSKCPNLEM